MDACSEIVFWPLLGWSHSVCECMYKTRTRSNQAKIQVLVWRDSHEVPLLAVEFWQFMGAGRERISLLQRCSPWEVTYGPKDICILVVLSRLSGLKKELMNLERKSHRVERLERNLRGQTREWIWSKYVICMYQILRQWKWVLGSWDLMHRSTISSKPWFDPHHYHCCNHRQHYHHYHRYYYTMIRLLLPQCLTTPSPPPLPFYHCCHRHHHHHYHWHHCQHHHITTSIATATTITTSTPSSSTQLLVCFYHHQCYWRYHHHNIHLYRIAITITIFIPCLSWSPSSLPLTSPKASLLSLSQLDSRTAW